MQHTDVLSELRFSFPRGLAMLSQPASLVRLQSLGTRKTSFLFPTPTRKSVQLDPNWRAKLILRINMVKVFGHLFRPRFHECRKNANQKQKQTNKQNKTSLGDVKTRRPQVETDTTVVVLHLPGSTCGCSGCEGKAYMAYSHDNSLVTGLDIIMRVYYTSST